MSKKILKRSLALGALMAFVITGQALAAEVAIVEPEMPHNGGEFWNKSETIEVLGKNGLQSDAVLSRDYALEEDTKDEAANAAKGYSYNPSSSYPDTYLFDLNGNTLTVPGGIAVDGKDSFKIIGTDGSALYLNGGLSIRGTVDIDTLDINNGNLYVYGSKMTVTTKSVSINNTSSGINVQGDNDSKGGNITVTTDFLTVKSGARALRAAYEGTLNVTAGDVEITSTKSSGASYGAALNLTAANEGSIESDFFAGEIEKGIQKGTVNLTLGKDVVWTGKVTTEDTGTGEDASQGIVNLSGTWNLKDVSTDLTGTSNSLTKATFNASSKFVIDGNAFKYDDAENATNTYALNGVGTGASLTVVDGAKIVINKGVEEGIYNVAQGFEKGAGENWTLEAENALWYADWADVDGADDTLHATIRVKSAQQMVESGVATNENKGILVDIAGSDIKENVNPTVDAIKELVSVESNLTSDQQQKAIAAVLQVGESGGFTGNVVSVSKQVNGSVGARNSFSGPKHGGPRHRGGHGPSVTEEANGSAIWAQYVHGKDKVDGIKMGGVDNAYDSQFNGVVLGADFKQVGSYASGIAFNYGEGDSHSKKNVVQSDSEFDFWGVSYYGAIKKQDTNFIFDIGYSESDSDVEQVAGSDTITANPEASTWTAGVKVEKLIDKGAVQIVPYAGLRFMTIDTDDYEAKGSTASEATYYSTERQDIWLLPIGVSLSQENVYDSGWIVTPKADLSYTWAMGDTDSSMTVNMPGVANYDLGYTVMDDGSFMATVGLDAQKEDWTFGVAYSYQKGDSTRSDRWYVNARYSF